MSYAAFVQDLSVLVPTCDVPKADVDCDGSTAVIHSYACVLTMLLRLRQLCNHPQLLARAKGEGISPTDLLLQDEEEDPQAAEIAELAKLGEIERAVKLQGQESVLGVLFVWIDFDPLDELMIDLDFSFLCDDRWVDKVKKKFRVRIEEAAAAESQDDDAATDAFNCPICT